MMKKLRKHLSSFPAYTVRAVLISAVTHFMVYYLPLVFGKTGETVLSSAFDDSIPCIPLFVWIYVGAFLFWVWAFVSVYRMNPRIANRLLTADLIAKTVCVLFYCFYPCTLVQPETLTGPSAWALRIIYYFDKPTNLMPSMHCYMSCMAALPLFSRCSNRTGILRKVFCVVFALAVCASTLFTKQHVFIDVWTGIADAIGAWLISCLIWYLIERRHPAAKQA